MGAANYVPANQMLDLRLLNAEINAGLSTPKRDRNSVKHEPGHSGKSSRAKATGSKRDPVEIFSFK